MLEIIREYEIFRAHKQYYSIPERQVIRNQFRNRINEVMRA